MKDRLRTIWSRIRALGRRGYLPADPVTLLVIVAILVGVTTAASLVPAARAARVNPMTALRRE